MGREVAMDITVREAQPEDAEQLIAFVKRLSEEPHSSISLSPGEFTLTVEQEQRVLAEYAAAENSVYLVAVSAGEVIGVLNCRGGTRQSTRHSASLGISVARPWRNRRVGHMLMARAIEWARGTGVLKRLELDVFARNQVAIHLYEQFGFVVEGCRRQAMYRDGEYLDDLVMGLLL